MNTSINPEYAQVVFRDRSAGLLFRTGSTMTSASTVEFEGDSYPVVDVEVSSASHPFWSGRERIADTEGRVERFRRRYSGGRR
jgi:large subunit ribosomal protein L31